MKPTSIFRVENLDGIGPYQGVLDRGGFNTMGSPNHPMPRPMGVADSGSNFLCPLKEEFFCGFASLGSMFNWLNTIESTCYYNNNKRKRDVFDWLDSQQFHISIYTVTRIVDYDTCESGKQVFFRKDGNAVHVDILTFAAARVILDAAG